MSIDRSIVDIYERGRGGDRIDGIGWTAFWKGERGEGRGERGGVVMDGLMDGPGADVWLVLEVDACERAFLLFISEEVSWLNGWVEVLKKAWRG